MENKDDDDDDSASRPVGHIVNANYIRSPIFHQTVYQNTWTGHLITKKTGLMKMSQHENSAVQTNIEIVIWLQNISNNLQSYILPEFFLISRTTLGIINCSKASGDPGHLIFEAS
jgi:hypothetical protein